MTILKTVGLAGLAAVMGVSSTIAAAQGDLTRRPTKLPDLVLGTEDNRYHLSHKEYQLETGKSYKLKVISSGQTEYAVKAPGFFNSIFLRKVEAGDMEIKAVSLTELEFEQEGEAEIYFVPIKPGKFEFFAEGLEAKGMAGVFNIK
ncbi:copper-binding protein [Neptunomonas marina]|uniref:Copper-binding protein n=1 Tax=Neptunomonas marina TaxID=1815562 RepID=A0A437Q995_9GAMM|nr:copper-binding protein [Neptunomonas marina]RVU31152.1 copper-binding protein [Neptunomonas marina]